jgi:hypothetical protein
MEDGNDLGSVLNDQPVQEVQQPVEQPQEPVQQEPTDQGEPPAEPPAAKQPEPDLVPRKALMDERRKRQELEQWVRQNQQPPQQAKLTPEQFESNEAYIEALVEARTAQVVDKRLQQLTEQQRQQAQLAQMEADSQSLVTSGSAKYPDFNEVIGNPDLPITETMINTMLALDAGPDVAYHLGKNPAEAFRIAQLPPTSQAREIGQLAKKVTAPPPAPPQLPRTLTQTRSADGRYTPQAWTGPSPLNDILGKRN